MDQNNYNELIKFLNENNARLVAVTKTRSVAQIKVLYTQGQRTFGENRVQELLEKYDQFPSDANWHLIGHLQRNKVKFIAPFITLIHSVDSFKLLKEINKQAVANDRIIDCLLQFKIAEEDTKYGFDLDSVEKMLGDEAFSDLKNVNIVGVMGMATFTSDKEQVKTEFRTLKNIFDTLQKHQFSERQDSFKEISMGMSGDYELAVEEGSTLVRIGSLLFR